MRPQLRLSLNEKSTLFLDMETDDKVDFYKMVSFKEHVKLLVFKFFPEAVPTDDCNCSGS